MKRSCRILFCVAIISIIAGGAFAGKKEKTYSGRVISADSSLMMVKHGAGEKVFLISADVPVLFSPALKKAPDAKGAIEMCQTVRVDYVSEGKKLRAVSVTILKESDCYQ